MKKYLLLACVTILVISNTALHAQSCSAVISGGSCTGTELTADINGGPLAKLTWFDYTNNVFGADTISSQASISVVAGNHGTGSSSNQFDFPGGGIAIDKAGNIYVADVGNNRIQKWAPGAVSGITVAGGNGAGSAANQLSSPTNVFVDATGNVYVADAGNARIQKWAPGATNGITVAGGNGSGSSANQLRGPRAVYVDANGNMYIADTYNYRIQRWKAGANKGVTVAGGNGVGNGANQFYYPIDVYLDAAKNIYVADAFTEDANYHRVQKWAPGATSGVTVAGGNGEGANANQFGYLLSIYVDPAGTLYTTDNGVSGAPVSRVQKWLPGANSGITVAGGHNSGWDVLSYPTGIVVDKNGLIYVFDGPYSPKVQKYVPTSGIVDSTYIPSHAGSYSVQAVLKNGCTTTSNTLIVRAIPQTPTIYTTQPRGRGNLCGGGTDTFFVYASDDITNYTWTIPPPCSLLSNYNDSIIISVPAGFSSGKLTVKGSNLCGISQPDTLRILGKPVMPGSIKGPKSVYANQAGIPYSVADLDSYHNWIVPEGAVIQSGQGTASISVNWGSVPGIISVNSYNECGESNQRREAQVSIKRGFAEINEQAISNSLAGAFVFPNPVKNNASIKFTAVKQTNSVIELQDMNGRKLLQKEITTKLGSNTISLDVSTYPSGTYLVTIKNSETNIILKLAKL